MAEKLIRETRLPMKLFERGKVRDTWLWIMDGNLLMVATDRVSAFDEVVGAILGKGKILTKMSIFWFKFTKDIIGNHFITDSPANLYYTWYGHKNDLEGRSMLIKKADQVIPIECVVRGYLDGSGWREYQSSGKVCGIKLPPGLLKGSKLPRPIFTPATKAEQGHHDENISFDKMAHILDCRVLATQLKNISLELYEAASEHAESRGIIIADTKFEFGIIDGQLMLIDEVLTPDSSRFWDKDKWKPGQTQESFDKQFLRDYLESTDWDKKPPAPELPKGVVNKTAEKYKEALKRLLG